MYSIKSKIIPLIDSHLVNACISLERDSPLTNDQLFQVLRTKVL